MNKQPSRIGLYLVLIIALVAGYFYLNNQVVSQSNYTQKQLEQALEDNKVVDATIQQNREVPTGSVIVDTTDSGQKKVYVTDVNQAIELLNKYDIDITTRDVPGDNVFLTTLLPVLLTGALVIFLIMMMNRQMAGGGGGGNAKMMNFGKSRAKMMDPRAVKVTFKQVAGLSEEKEELEEIVDFLKNPKKYTDLGARIPKGVILVGPPGTGKTLLAKAVAGEAGVPFFSISGSDFVEMFVGVGASRVRDLFDEAKKNAPCIIFIDEIDAVARQRGTGLGGGHDEREQTLNQLLVEMDGFGVNEGIIVLAATNRKVFVNRPYVMCREEILKVLTMKKPLAEDLNLNDIARTTAGFAGADLENLMNEAAICAAKDNRAYIVKEDVDKSFIKVGIGGEKKSRLVPESERRITAYHESGHAILFHLLPHVGPVYTVSIIPTGTGAGGYTMPLPENDNVFMTKAKMLEDIKVSLGGRIAEELILEDITTGASQDIKQASQYARAMVTKYGMSEKLGLINYESDDQEEVFLGRDLGHAKNYSEKVAGAIDKEVKRIIDECYADARAILEAHEDILHKCAALLLEKERIDRAEFEALFDDVPNANSTANAEPSTI